MLRPPGEEYRLVVSMMWEAGAEYDLIAFGASQAFYSTLSVRASAGKLSEHPGARIFGLSIQALGEIEPRLRALIQAAGQQG